MLLFILWTQGLFCALSQDTPTSNPLPGAFSTHDTKTVHHYILTHSPGSKRGSLQKSTRITPVIVLLPTPLLTAQAGVFLGPAALLFLSHPLDWFCCLPRPSTAPTICLEVVLVCLKGNQPCSNRWRLLPSWPSAIILLSTYPVL